MRALLRVTTITEFYAERLSGETEKLAVYARQVILVVNTATECGLAPQFHGLEQLYADFKDQGFVVLGFPSNQFNSQEPGTNAQISEVCRDALGVSFPMFAKIKVNGRHQHPLFKWLKSQRRSVLGSAIKWNFTKFLVGRDGTVIKRYAPTTKPHAIAADIRAALAA